MPLVRGYMLLCHQEVTILSPQAAFTFCHHVTPDLARIDCNTACNVPFQADQSYCTGLPLVVAVVSATGSRVLLLDVGKVSEVMEDVVLSIPVTLRPCVVAEKREALINFFGSFSIHLYCR